MSSAAKALRFWLKHYKATPLAQKCMENEFKRTEAVRARGRARRRRASQMGRAA